MPEIKPKGLKLEKVSFETEAIPWVNNSCVEIHSNGQKQVILSNTANPTIKKTTKLEMERLEIGNNSTRVKQRLEMGSEDIISQEYKTTFMTRRAVMFPKDFKFIDILTKFLEFYSIILFVAQTSLRIKSIKHPYSPKPALDWNFGSDAVTIYFILQWFLRLYIIIKWKDGKNNFRPFLLGRSGLIRTSTFVSLINMTLEGMERRTFTTALIRFFISFFVEKYWEC